MSGSGRRSAAARGSDVAAFTTSLVRRADGLAAATDPLHAEMMASGVLSMWHADRPDDAAALEALGRAVLRRLAGCSDPDVLAPPHRVRRYGIAAAERGRT